ncbi:MAG: hypothetical protein NTV81_02905 [Candidatus Komeilibacteria bacterium]|nr:hypothetical protein [Candidatus Komeilibacteria bacterium]
MSKENLTRSQIIDQLNQFDDQDDWQRVCSLLEKAMAGRVSGDQDDDLVNAAIDVAGRISDADVDEAIVGVVVFFNGGKILAERLAKAKKDSMELEGLEALVETFNQVEGVEPILCPAVSDSEVQGAPEEDSVSSQVRS